MLGVGSNQGGIRSEKKFFRHTQTDPRTRDDNLNDNTANKFLKVAKIIR